MKTTFAVLCVFLLIFFATALPVPAAVSDVAGSVKALSEIRDFEQVTISPDGAEVAWVELLRDASGAPSRNTAIYCRSRNESSATPRRISAASGKTATEHHIAWSPDSRQIVFVSDADKSMG